MISWFAKNDVAANVLLVVIMLSGWYFMTTKVPVDMFPEVESRDISIQMSLPGASPHEVESGITIKMEEAIQDLEGIERITSRSQEGRASVVVQVEDGFAVRELLEDIKVRVDSISGLPVDAEKLTVQISQRRREAIGVMLYGNAEMLALHRQAEHIKDELLQLPDVKLVELDNTTAFEIAIEIPELVLQEYGLSLAEVAEIIADNAKDVSAGNLKTEGGDIFIRTIGKAEYGDAFAEIPMVTSAEGVMLRLGDIALIRDGFEESPRKTRFNGEPAIEIEVFRTGNQNIMDVTRAVRDYINVKQAQLPPGLKLDYWRDRSKPIEARLATLTQSAWQGAVLVVVMLALFLRPSVALWVCMGIPMCFLGTFILMPLLGVSINMMSLFGFILVLGIVVDDAIVTGENVYSHLQRGQAPLQAAIVGTREVAVPVTFGILTTVAAFLPLLYLNGRASWYASITYVVIPVLLLSLVESKLILPAHLKHVRPQADKTSTFSRVQQTIAGSLDWLIATLYQPALSVAMRWRYASVMLMIGVFIVVLSTLFSGHSRFVFFPRIQSEVAAANVIMPAGTSFETTDQVVTAMVQQASDLRELYRDPVSGQSVISNIYAVSGGANAAAGRVRVETVPPEQRILDVKTQDIVNEWRKRVGEVPGAEQLNYKAEIGGWRGAVIDIELKGHNTASLQALTQSLTEHLSGYSGVFDIEDSLSDGKEELQLLLKPEAHLLGLDLDSIARQVRQAIYGYEVQRIQRDREEVRVMLRYPLSARKSLSTLENMMISLPGDANADKRVPLWQVAELQSAMSPQAILRIDRQRTVALTADFDKTSGDLNIVQAEIAQWLAEQTASLPGVSYSLVGEAKDQKESTRGLLGGAGALILLVYILLAIPLKSYLQPFIVLAIIPFGIVGAILGHWLLGFDLTLLSFMGMLALSGVVVNDSLVLVDYINQRRVAGMSVKAAAFQAGSRRFRPVLLTSMTTFVGLMPLLFEKTTQAQFLIPMAVSLGFGIIFCTLITLFIVPLNYLIMEDIKAYFRAYRKDVKGLLYR